MMNNIGDFFLFCSGADRKILEQSPTELNKYKGVGATVFFTGLFAFVASSYALFTVFNNYFTSVLFGLLWGLLIFNLDRYIVSSLKKKGNPFYDFALALPRLILAVIISLVISKPLELKIFETEINAEIISMQQEKRMEHETLLKSRFENDLAEVDAEILAYNAQLTTLRTTKESLTAEALKEADGTGGSKIRNMGPIYKAKIAAAEKAGSEYQTKEAELNPKLLAAETRKNDIIKNRDAELKKMEFAAMNGFASRMEALSRITSKSHAIYLASIFLILLFIAIETAPMFVKLISERAPYDYLLDKVEVDFEMDHKEVTTMRKMVVNHKLDFEKQTRGHQNQETITAENELFSHAIKSEVDAVKRNSLSLKEYLSRGRMVNS